MIRRRSKVIPSGGLGLSTLLVLSLARAQLVEEAGPESGEPAPPAPLEAQRNVGVLLTLGSYTGFGGGVQLGTPAVGVRASAGWVPVLISYEEPEEDPELKLYSGFQLAGDAYLRGLETRHGASIGVTSGYRYHSLLGNGAALGGYGTFRLNDALDGFVQGGLVWFFSGEDKLREKKGDDLPENVKFGWPGPAFNYLISAGLVLFP
ncbi:MAG TPA: hypothetical protein VI197_31390 [Polyangiaceae bacterium]